MPRWEPGTRDRLERAALELFASRGYAEVTVQDIARHAGVGKATFFRIFPDKREVLFWGQDLLVTLFVEGVAGAAEGASVIDQVAASLSAVATAFPPERHDLAGTRDAVVAQHPDLQERLAHKRAVLRDALRDALAARGAPEAEAALGAEIGRAAFSAAYAQWAHSDTLDDFALLADRELDALLNAAAHLASDRQVAASS